MTFSHNIESLLVSPTSHALNKKKKKNTLFLIDWEDTSILSKKKRRHIYSGNSHFLHAFRASSKTYLIFNFIFSIVHIDSKTKYKIKKLLSLIKNSFRINKQFFYN